MFCIIKIINDPSIKETNIINYNNILINIINLENYEIRNVLKIIKIYGCKKYNITISDEINNIIGFIIVSFINDILYSYKDKPEIIFTKSVYNDLYNEYNNHKDIIINPSKTPKTYLEWIKSRIPRTYDCIQLDKKYYPLTESVGQGSRFPENEKSYMIHIKPKNINPNYKTIYLVGKGITYDSGGMNLKPRNLNHMKTDMTGSAIVISVLNLLKTKSYNINIIIPIAENMISNIATKPGEVYTAFDRTTIEINNTDAEGRLCLADAMIYINHILKPSEDSIIIDIATLTGGTLYISDTLSAIVMSNNKGRDYYEKLYKIGELTSEYVDYLNIRNENINDYKSSVAIINNSPEHSRSGTIDGGAFIKYFTNDNIPWLHIDVASVVYNDVSEKPLSYGVLLLYYFIMYYMEKK